jgi:hypothetical protein
LEAANKQLAARNAELRERFTKLAALSNEVLNSNAQLVAEYKKLRAENVALSGQADTPSNELARAIRLNSALAIANSLKAAPVQVTMPNLNCNPLNCTSNAIGSTTYMNCQ